MNLHRFYFFQCLATIATVYWRSNEESVEGERPQRAPALESRDSATAVDTRADRVQGKTNNTNVFAKRKTNVSEKTKSQPPLLTYAPRQ